MYSGIDFLEAHKDEIERGLYGRMADLFNLDVELVFYDTMSLRFEIDGEDGGSLDSGPGDGKAGPGLRRQASRRTTAGMRRRWWSALR